MFDSPTNPKTRPMVASQGPLATGSQLTPSTSGVLAAELRMQPEGGLAIPAALGPTPSAGQLPSMNSKQRLALTEQLLNEHHDRVYRYAFHMLGCQTSAEDIAQEVFVRAYSNAHQLRSLEAAAGWLLAITRNEIARWCGKRAPGPLRDFDPAVDSRHEQQFEDHDWVHQAIQQLPLEFRQVVLMFYFEQKSYTEIATELELPIGTVMSRLNRARGHLKDSLIALSGLVTGSGTEAVRDYCDHVKKESKR